MSPYPKKTVSLVQEYIGVFAPLVLEECAALLMRGQEEAELSQATTALVASSEEVLPFCGSLQYTNWIQGRCI